MKTQLYLSILAAAAMGLSSCQDDANNFMVDDTIGLLNGGLVEVEVYDGVEDPLNFYAIKAGKGFQNADVTLAVDNDVLIAYNEANATQYEALPAECYSISIPTLNFTKDDYRKSFQIKWDRAALKSALEANANFVIPVRMNVAETGVNVDESRLTALIHPSVEIPTLGLNIYGFTTGLTPTRRSAIEEDVYFEVQSNFIAQNDIDIKFTVDPTLVAEYNEANGTSFEVIPDDAIRFETEGWTLKKYLNSTRIKFTFVREALIPEEGSSKFGSYMIPLRVTSAKTGNVDYNFREGEDYMLYTVNVVAAEIEKTGWTIHSYSDQASIANDPDANVAKGNYPLENLIDGATSTVWRSVWSVKPELPCEVVIDLGQERDIFKLRLNNGATAYRQYNGVKAGTYSVSLDGESFTEVGNFSFAAISTAQSEAEVGPCRGRYVKLTFTEMLANAKNGLQLAEFSAWGE